MILVDPSQTWRVKSKSVSDLDFADWTWSNIEINPSKCWLQMYPWQQDEWGNILSLIHSGADQKNRPHSVQCHQFIHQKHPVNMARLFQWGIGDQFEMFSENLWIARDHKCDEKPHRLPRGPGEVNQNCPHHHHQHPHHHHIINPRFECTVDMRCLVSYIQWFHTTPDNGGSEYWRTKIQNFQEHRSLQDNRS